MTEIKTIKKVGNILEIDGEYYEPLTEPSKDKIVFKKIDKKEHDKMVKDVVDRLANYLNKKQILRDAICELPMSEIEKVQALLKSKGVKPKIRQRFGCIELHVGESIIQIR